MGSRWSCPLSGIGAAWALGNIIIWVISGGFKTGGYRLGGLGIKILGRKGIKGTNYDTTMWRSLYKKMADYIET